jgi:hypothetical protein
LNLHCVLDYVAGHTNNFADAKQQKQNNQYIYRGRRFRDGIESCAGSAPITRGFGHFGYDMVAMDKSYSPADPVFDLSTDEGFVRMVRLVIETRDNGLMFMSPECKTWIFISRFQYGRSRNNLDGDTSRTDVRQQNRLAEHIAQLLVLCVALGVHVMIEQPSSSLMFMNAHVSAAITLVQARSQFYRRISVQLRSWGAPSQKPIVLQGCAPYLQAFLIAKYNSFAQCITMARAHGIDLLRTLRVLPP